MDEGSCNSAGSGKVKNDVTDMLTEVANVVMAGARKGGHLFGKGKLESKINPRLKVIQIADILDLNIKVKCS